MTYNFEQRPNQPCQGGWVWGVGGDGGIGLQMPQRHRPQRKICKQPVFLQAVQWVLATGLGEQPLRLVKCQ